jgi:UDP-N-acetylmuramyl pentapeptide phosphotransferase/UDP-N-acetylglucosamine-1-phosphate transferase
VRWLPLAASFVLAGLLAPALLLRLERAGVVRENYRGVILPAASGTLIAIAAVLALGPLAAIEELTDGDTLAPEVGSALVFVLGVGVLGLLDDLLGGRRPAGARADAEAPRGLRGHARAVAGGRFSTGMLKAAGVLGLALYVLAGQGRSASEYLLGVGVLVLSTNLFNLLDLRPGRAGKAFLALGVVLTLGSWDTYALEALGLFIGPALVLLPYDLRERAMLGDTGSNVLGAVAGVWLVLALGPTGEAVAVGVLALWAGGLAMLARRELFRGDADRLAAMLERLLGDPGLARRLGAAARRRAEERFALARQVDRLLAVWSGVVGEAEQCAFR